MLKFKFEINLSNKQLLSTPKHHGKWYKKFQLLRSFNFRIQVVLEEQHKIFKHFRKATLSNTSNYVTILPRAFRKGIGWIHFGGRICTLKIFLTLNYLSKYKLLLISKFAPHTFTKSQHKIKCNWNAKHNVDNLLNRLCYRPQPCM